MQVLDGHQRTDNVMEDFCDGKIYKDHPLFSQDKSALQIMLYYDEVELCNPLGSRVKVHKLGMLCANIDTCVRNRHIVKSRGRGPEE